MSLRAMSWIFLLVLWCQIFIIAYLLHFGLEQIKSLPQFFIPPPCFSIALLLLELSYDTRFERWFFAFFFLGCIRTIPDDVRRFPPPGRLTQLVEQHRTRILAGRRSSSCTSKIYPCEAGTYLTRSTFVSCPTIYRI